MDRFIVLLVLVNVHRYNNKHVECFDVVIRVQRVMADLSGSRNARVCSTIYNSEIHFKKLEYDRKIKF